MRKSKIDEEVKIQFSNRTSISRGELLDFYRKYEPDLNNRTFGWRIWDLKKKNIIYSVAKGIYRINYNKKNYAPVIDDRLKQIYATIHKTFNNLEIVLWDSKWINDFSLHQTFKNFYILETQSDHTESVFFKLKDLGIGNPFLKPDESNIYQHMLDVKEPIVVKQLIKRAPTRKTNKIVIPSIEKILVDLYSDEKIFYMYQGNELKEIYHNVLNDYFIDFSKLINYASRRGKDQNIKGYLFSNFSSHVEGFIK
jgi:hypothetical protein